MLYVQKMLKLRDVGSWCAHFSALMLKLNTEPLRQLCRRQRQRAWLRNRVAHACTTIKQRLPPPPTLLPLTTHPSLAMAVTAPTASTSDSWPQAVSRTLPGEAALATVSHNSARASPGSAMSNSRAYAAKTPPAHSHRLLASWRIASSSARTCSGRRRTDAAHKTGRNAMIGNQGNEAKIQRRPP